MDDDAEFCVRPTKQARREGGKLFNTPREHLWVVGQLKLLRHWPMDPTTRDGLAVDLDFSTVDHQGETFYELRLGDPELHRKNLRVFFWVDDSRKTIWVVHGYWKKTRKLDRVVLHLVAGRVKRIKGSLQDGSVI